MASTGGNSAVSGSSTSPSSNVPVATVPKPREKIPGYIFGDVIGTGAYAKVRRCYSEKFKSNVSQLLCVYGLFYRGIIIKEIQSIN